MKKNMGGLDRMLRLSAVVLVGILYFTGLISGTAAIILAAISVIFLLTSFVGVCPLYLPFKLSTRGKEA